MEVRRGAGMQPVAGDDERGARRDKTIVAPAPDSSVVAVSHGVCQSMKNGTSSGHQID
jgi:hypothetical protein